MRMLLVTGKGGVGKTTVAAATALGCAERGLRTLVLSTDRAHSLADVFEEAIAGAPVELSPRLWAQQIDATTRLEESWSAMQRWLGEVMGFLGAGSIEAEEVALLPGFEQVLALADLERVAEQHRWDVVVVDCAATADTLRLLSLPDVLPWYLQRLFGVGRRVNRIIAPVIGRLTSLPVASDDVAESVARLHAQLQKVKALLADERRASVRLVLNPERLSVEETRRTYTYLCLYGYPVDAVVANRILPSSLDDPWFARWKEHHAQQLTKIEEGFDPLPVLRAEVAPDEIVGIEALRLLAAELYGERDPSVVLHTSRPLSIVRVEGGYELAMLLPFARREELELGRRRDELVVGLDGHRRCILLPDSLRRREVSSATLVDGVLQLRFADPLPQGPASR